jgi:hypothetical protein
MLKPLSLLLLSLLTAWNSWAQSRAIVKTDQISPKAPRLALVIGNSAYQHTSPLRNPANDAQAMSQTLRQLNFQVTTLTDSNQRSMESALRQFGRQLRDEKGVGLFYYAGHGMQVDGENYLLPVDIHPSNETDLRYDAVPVGKLLGQMKSAGNPMNLVILDACRNNPFQRSFRAASQGLAQVVAPTGTFISYATAPGSVAADGEGRNGLFTEKLLQHMNTPGLKLEEVFKRVRAAVQRESNNRQVPWDASSVTGDFYFLPTGQPLPPPPQTAALPRQFRPDEEAWELVKSSEDPGDVRYFLERFPESPLRSVAELKLRMLEKQKPGATAEPPPTPGASLSQASEARDLPQINPEGLAYSLTFNGHTYAVTRKRMNFFTSGRFAKLREAGLVTLGNRQENDLLVASFLSENRPFLWIGLSRTGNGRNWWWMDGRSDYTNWLPGQPSSDPLEQCAALLHPDSQWHDVPCSVNKAALLEWDFEAGNADLSGAFFEDQRLHAWTAPRPAQAPLQIWVRQAGWHPAVLNGRQSLTRWGQRVPEPSGAWVGLRRLQGGRWVWEDGTLNQMNLRVRGRGDCVLLLPDGYLQTAACEEAHPVLLQHP